ncbi:MAG: hypothetical protein V3S14_02415, partial [Anaerolineae bacterium]
MKCPNCNHVSDTALLKCSACDEAYDRNTLETLQHLEYLLVWLRERADKLGTTHTRLHNEALSQLGDLRSSLGLAPLPSPEEIAPQLALVEATLQQLPSWVRAAGTSPASATELRAYLSAQANDLKRQLAGRTVRMEPLSDLQVLDFALKSLPLWTKALSLSHADASSLRHYLDQERTALLQPIAHKLALVKTVLQQLEGWVKGTRIRPAAANILRRHLSNQANHLQKELADRPVKVEDPSHLQVLDFAAESLPEWATKLLLTSADVASLRQHLDRKRTELVQRIAQRLALVKAALGQLQGWAEVAGIPPTSANNLYQHISARASYLERGLAGRSVKVGTLSDLQVIDFALGSLSSWTEGILSASDVASLRNHLNETRTALLQPTPPPPPVPEEVTPSAPPTPVPAPKPIPKAPPKPKRPPIDWGKVWEKAVKAAVSGALLRGLLYLGAFMIVVSAAILVILSWDIFPEMVQLAFIAAVPAAFYLVGWGARAKLNLTEVGSVLTGIGALLVAVSFAGVYQFGELYARVNGNAYWLGASLFCTAVYITTAWQLPGEFFDYITLIGGSSTLLAFTRLLDLPIEWSVASVTTSSVLMIGVAVRFGQAVDRLGDFGRAARRLPQILIPASLAVVLFVPGDAALGQAGAFVLSTLGYGLLAWRFPAALFAHATVWSSVGAVGFAIRAVSLPNEWYATVAAVLGFLYILAGRWMEERLGKDWKPRRGYLAAAYLAGFGLVAIAVLAGFATLPFDLWAGIIALTLAALAFAACAYLFRRPILVLFASGLFIAPFSLAVVQWLSDFAVAQWGAWLMAAWAGLALIYLGIAALLRAADKYGRWLNLWAHALTFLASCGLIVNYGLAADEWFAGPTLAALGGVILVYLVSAVIHDSGQHPALSNWVTWLPDRIGQGVFLWPIGLLLPIWLTVFWSATAFDWPWLGVALAAFALTYVGLGQMLSERKMTYRLPLHAYVYPLAVTAIVVAWGDKWALLTTLYIVVGVLVGLASVYRRVLETVLAALLFIWPFQLSLDISLLTPHAHSLAYALLASLVYVPLGTLLDQQERKLALPAYVVGYGLSAYAVAASLLGRFGAYRQDLAWVGVAVPLIITGLQVFGVYRFRRSPFAWASALTFAIAFGQTLTLLQIPFEYAATAWVGLAVAYMLAERVLARVKKDAWFRTFRWPLGIGTIVLCTLGLLLTASGTATAFTGGQVENVFPLIVAQALAVGLAVLTAWLYRSRWPLYLEPWLAFFPVTLFFIGYGQAIFGQPLTTPQYGIVWSALGLVHLLAGVLLDRAKVRYAHGSYLGGYA